MTVFIPLMIGDKKVGRCALIRASDLIFSSRMARFEFDRGCGPFYDVLLLEVVIVLSIVCIGLYILV